MKRFTFRLMLISSLLCAGSLVAGTTESAACPRNPRCCKVKKEKGARKPAEKPALPETGIATFLLRF
jgi:hypothetical protein